MATQVQRRRGTASEHNTFTGAAGEVTVNTTNDSLHVHDGATAGGFELARSDGSNMPFGAAGKVISISPLTVSDTTISFNESPIELGNTGAYYTPTGRFSATINKQSSTSILLVFFAYTYRRADSGGAPHSLLVWADANNFQKYGYDQSRWSQEIGSTIVSTGTAAFAGMPTGNHTFNVAATRGDSNSFSGVLNDEENADQADPFTSYIYIMEVES